MPARIRIGNQIYARDTRGLNADQREVAVGLVESSLDGVFKELAIQLDIPGPVWSVLDDAGLRGKFEESARRFVAEVMEPWYEAATRR
jgi:hypothetical protein